MSATVPSDPIKYHSPVSMETGTVQPDSDGGATCPCGNQFNFKVWILGYWDCPRCGLVFTVTKGIK